MPLLRSPVRVPMKRSARSRLRMEIKAKGYHVRHRKEPTLSTYAFDRALVLHISKVNFVNGVLKQ